MLCLGVSLAGTILLASGCDSPLAVAPKPAPVVSCDLNAEACEAITPWGKAQLTLSPRPVPVLKPIELTLRFALPVGAQGTVDLTGADMEMGTTTTELVRIDAQTLRSSLVIPVCLTGSMQWRLRVNLSNGPQVAGLDFAFMAPTLSAPPKH